MRTCLTYAMLQLGMGRPAGAQTLGQGAPEPTCARRWVGTEC